MYNTFNMYIDVYKELFYVTINAGESVYSYMCT